MTIPSRRSRLFGSTSLLPILASCGLHQWGLHPYPPETVVEEIGQYIGRFR